MATTRPFLVPTSTLQPVPQKRQGALSHRISSFVFAKASFTPGIVIPAVVAVAAIAFVLMKSLRVSFITRPPIDLYIFLNYVSVTNFIFLINLQTGGKSWRLIIRRVRPESVPGCLKCC